jgi:hypothetical protein
MGKFTFRTCCEEKEPASRSWEREEKGDKKRKTAMRVQCGGSRRAQSPGSPSASFIGDIRPVTERSTATSVANSNHHSPHWLIRGVTPHCRIRRWVIRQSARLYRLGVKTPRGQKALFGPSAFAVRWVRSPDGFDSTIATPSRSKTLGRIALSGRGPVRRRREIGGCAAWRGCFLRPVPWL